VPEVINRKQASNLGLKKYFTGKMCPHGHISERYVSGGNCIACLDEFVVLNPEKVRASKKKWNVLNPEKKAALNLKWCRANPEKVAAKNKKAYASNPEKYRKKIALWRANNPDKVKEQNKRKWLNNREGCLINKRTRRARKRNNGGSHTAQDIMELFIQQNERCAYCKAQLTIQNKHVDHIMPLALGGSNDRSNLQILCAPCNQSKSSKHPIDYCRSIGIDVTMEVSK